MNSTTTSIYHTKLIQIACNLVDNEDFNKILYKVIQVKIETHSTSALYHTNTPITYNNYNNRAIAIGYLH